MKQAVYSAESQLRSPHRFVSSIKSDLSVAPTVAWRLFLRNLLASHRQSWLGYFWLVIPPLTTSATWIYLNAAKVINTDQTNLPYPVFVLVGTLLWQLFTEALRSPLQQLSTAGSILTKSRIPHEALFLAGIIEVLFNFAVRFIVLLPVLVWAAIHWNLPVQAAPLLLAPLGVLTLLFLGFGLGLLLTPLGLLYQDVSRALGIVIGFWFLLTPVIYPAPKQGLAHWVTTLNPVAPLLTTTRNWLTSEATSPTSHFYVVAVLALATLLVGWLFHRLARPHIIARLG